MSIHRFYIPSKDWNPDALVLIGSEAHHARDVLRLQRGDKVVLFNGRGREITAEIVDLRPDEIHLRKLSETDTPPLRCHLALAQGAVPGQFRGPGRVAFAAGVVLQKEGDLPVAFLPYPVAVRVVLLAHRVAVGGMRVPGE